MRRVKKFPGVWPFYFSTNPRQFVSLLDIHGQFNYLVKFRFTVKSLSSFHVSIEGFQVMFFGRFRVLFDDTAVTISEAVNRKDSFQISQ